MKYFIVIILLLVFAACQQKHEAQEDVHAHDHEVVKLQLDSYNQKFEVFAEADPFVVGEPSNILAHFTWLENFKALESGKITISMIVGTKGIREVQEKPLRKGIYSFQLKPVAEGVGMIIFDIETNGEKYQIIVPHIEVFADEHDAIHEAEHHAVSDPNAIAFTKEQSWKIDFETSPVELGPFGQIIRTSAKVLPLQNDEVIVPARTSGIVKFSGKTIIEGIDVVKGENMFSISGAGLAENNASVRFAEARTNFEKCKAEYERSKKLAKDQIVSAKQLQEAKSAYETAEAVFINLEKNFNEKGQNVSSPASGFIKHLHVANGEFVEAGQPLFSVVQNNAVLLQADVQQKYAPVLSSISGANIRIPASNKVYTLNELNGKPVSYARTTNADNYMLPVSFQLENNGEFLAGSFVDLFIQTETSKEAITVPNGALLEEQGNYSVFVQLTPELFVKTEVKTGVTNGFRTEIVDGLKTGDRVVSKGAIWVKLAQASGALDPHAGHVH